MGVLSATVVYAGTVGPGAFIRNQDVQGKDFPNPYRSNPQPELEIPAIRQTLATHPKPVTSRLTGQASTNTNKFPRAEALLSKHPMAPHKSSSTPTSWVAKGSRESREETNGSLAPEVTNALVNKGGKGL